MSIATRKASNLKLDGASYPYLMSPLRVGPLALPNRGVMGAMHTRLETLDRARERTHAFYRARSSTRFE